MATVQKFKLISREHLNTSKTISIGSLITVVENEKVLYSLATLLNLLWKALLTSVAKGSSICAGHETDLILFYNLEQQLIQMIGIADGEQLS